MKKFLRYSFLLFTIFSHTVSHASERLSFGIGSSALYNGWGINVAYITSADFKYVSLGCHDFLSASGYESSSNCGVGAGWITPSILSEGNKHGIGVHVSANHNTFNNLNETVYFIGIPYIYDPGGISSGGWYVGFTPAIAMYSTGTKTKFWLNWGYQF